MDPIKPGVFTTEFILTTIASVIAFLVSIGWLGPSESAEIQASIAKIVTGITAVVTLWKYIQTRFLLKEKSIELDTNRLIMLAKKEDRP